ncbi:IS3 family transposase [Paenibacillus sp. LHD-38]
MSIFISIIPALQFYNNERFQKKLNNLSPVEYRAKVVIFILAFLSF